MTASIKSSVLINRLLVEHVMDVARRPAS